MKKPIILALICFSIVIYSCKQHSDDLPELKNEDISHLLNHMTELMIHDITNPPLAARFFSYACISGYEVVSQQDSSLPKLDTILNNYPNIPIPDSIQGDSNQLSAILAMLFTAQEMQPSGSELEKYEKRFLDSCRRIGFSDDVIEASKKYARAVCNQVLSYANADRYNKISNFPRYAPIEKPGYWYPTPPAFMAAVEPYFSTIRPFTLDSAAQFKPDSPIPFSIDKESAFYKELLNLAGDSLTKEEKEIAAFWDCNPFALQDNGHLMYGIKKISPGAHWVGITNIACAKANKNFEETMFINTIVSAGLMDAFLSCWDEKYRSNRIRPETAVRKYVDASWEPFLQTPPFPEYTSGHSVASGASATILTHFFGENFSYTDSVEVKYGLPPRHFTSFYKAAEEAAISRFYGGIHYMDAIEKGLQQGKNVGEWVVKKVQ